MGKTNNHQNLMKTSLKNMMKINTGYFLEVYIDYPKELLNFHKDLPFLHERKKGEKVEKLICSIEDKKKMLFT